MSDAGSALGQQSHKRDLAPLPFTLPSAPAESERRPRARSGVVLGLAMYALALWMAVQNDTFRSLEARMVTPVAGFFTGQHPAVRVGSIVYFALGTPRRFGLNITDECTSALLLIPLLVMMGSFAIFTRLDLRRQLFALLCGSALILVVNIFRIVGIAWATWQWGLDPGYTYSHIFVGSAFSLVGFVTAMLLSAWLLVRGDRPKLEQALRVSRAWWAARAPASHRVRSGERGLGRGRPPAEHAYRRRK